SNSPPIYPDSAPNTIPTINDKPAAPSANCNDTLLPHIVMSHTSLPISSVPKKWSPDGLRRGAPTECNGLPGLINGASIAVRINIASTLNPIKEDLSLKSCFRVFISSPPLDPGGYILYR